MSDHPMLNAFESLNAAEKQGGMWLPMRQVEFERTLLGCISSQATMLLLWLRSGNRCYYSEQAEKYDYVGPWVESGFVVSRFTRKPFAEAARVSTRSVSKYLQELEAGRYIKVVHSGTNKGESKDSTPLVCIVGVWNSDEKDKRTPMFAYWWEALGAAASLPDHDAHEWAKENLRRIQAIKRDNRKGGG